MFRGTARIYDLLYEAIGKDYAAEAEQLDAQVQQRNPGARSLLDVGCGTGGHLRHLQRAYHVVGVDADPAMLAVARESLPGVELIEADMRSLALPATFDAIVCLFSSIGYMRDVDELHSAVTAMARHLDPRGVLIVDGWVRPGAWKDAVSPDVALYESDDLTVVRVTRSRREGNLTFLDMHHLIASSESIDHVVDQHRLTLFTDEEYRAAFSQAGLSVEVVPSPMPARDRYIGQAPR